MGKKLLKLARSLTKKAEKVDQTFGPTWFFDEDIEELVGIIADVYDVDLGLFPSGDEAFNYILDYAERNRNLKETEKKLKEISKKQNER